MDDQTFLLLYKSIVHHHVEFANSVWCPLKLGDIEEMEKIQKRATKLIIKLKHKQYKERPIHLNLPTLKYRWLCEYMTEVFKIIHNIYNAKVSLQLMLNENHTFHYDLHKHFFCTYCKYVKQFAEFCC